MCERDRWQRGGRASDGLPETRQRRDLLRGRLVPALNVLLEPSRVEVALLRARATRSRIDTVSASTSLWLMFALVALPA